MDNVLDMKVKTRCGGCNNEIEVTFSEALKGVLICSKCKQAVEKKILDEDLQK